MATITKRKSKKHGWRYRAEVRIKGLEPMYKTFPKRALAKKWADRLETKLKYESFFTSTTVQSSPNNPVAPSSSEMTLGEIIDLYFEHIDNDPELRGDRHYKNKKGFLRWWKKHLGERSLTEADHRLLKKYIKIIKYKRGEDNPHPGSTVRQYFFALSSLYIFGIDEDYVADNPVTKVRNTREFKKLTCPERDRFLTEDEKDRFLTACKRVDAEANNSLKAFDELYLCVLLLLLTGGRKQAILNIKWSDINFDEKTLTIIDAKGDKLSKSVIEKDGKRIIPLTESLLVELRKYRLRCRKDTDYLFPSKNGKKARDIRKPFNKALKYSGIEDFTVHDCKHYFCSSLRAQKVSEADIRDTVLHKSVKMTARYSHARQEEIDRINLEHQERLLTKTTSN